MEYRPRTQSRKYRDADCPEQVLAIYDNGGTSADRYTVFYKGVIDYSSHFGAKYIACRHMSSNPMRPQGIGRYDELTTWEVAHYRDRNRRHAAKWSSLPEEVKRCVRLDCQQLASEPRD